MKKLLSLLTLITLLLSVVGCNKMPDIDDEEWVMTIAQNQSGIVAHHPNEPVEFDNHSGVDAIELICTAKNGKLTFTDKTNSKIYEGSYEETEKDKDSRHIKYNVQIGDADGYALITVSETLNGDEYYSLVIVVGSYAMNFKVR